MTKERLSPSKCSQLCSKRKEIGRFNYSSSVLFLYNYLVNYSSGVGESRKQFMCTAKCIQLCDIRKRNFMLTL